ncbi:MAG: TonB-dependent receptor [Bacteroidota bacterium]
MKKMLGYRYLKSKALQNKKVGILAVFVFMFSLGFSQQPLETITITLGSGPKDLFDLFETVEEQTRFNFAFESGLKNGPLQTKLKGRTTLKNVLDVLSTERGLDFKLIGNTIYVKPRPLPENLGSKGTIAGTITDNLGIPVAFASIILKNTTYGASSDENGKFSFSAPSGKHTIVTKVIGYTGLERPITVRPNAVVSIAVQLFEESEQLEEVKVYGKSEKEKLEQSAKAVIVVETKLAKQETADLGEVLARSEGVSVQRAGGLGSNTRFSLNGLTDDQIRFFIDGIPLDFMGYSFGLANVPVNLVERAEVYKGVVPIEFGADALGGAVNLVSSSNYVGTSGAASYQVGSFGTHRLTLNYHHRPRSKGLFIDASAFFDLTDNNYKIDVEIPDERGRLSPETVERFHDGFRALGLNLNVGFRELSWANLFSLRLFASDFDRDIQNNLIMTIPYGEVTNGTRALGGYLHWQKRLERWPDMDLILGYSRSTIDFRDLSQVVYNWFGEPQRNINEEVIIRAVPGEIGDPRDVELIDDAVYARLTLTQTLGQGHQLRFSSSPTATSRKGNDLLIEDPDALDPLGLRSDVFSWVNGLEYQWVAESGKWDYLAFVKNYVQRVFAEQLVVTEIDELNRDTNEWGGGSSFRYEFREHWSVKASYEWATRLPRASEIFGDGALILANVDLEPERSHNANLSITYDYNGFDRAAGQISINGFLRDAENLIVVLGSGQTFSSQNVFGAISKGLEVSGNWRSANERLGFSLGGTYQDFRNNASEGTFSAFKGDRIPNRPYLFANGSIRYVFPKTFGTSDELGFFGNTRYVHEFFRNWESIGNPEFKQEIPEQLVHTAGITYRLELGKVSSSITAELQNLTNGKVFDFFGVQRPGRAFFVKLTAQF